LLGRRVYLGVVVIVASIVARALRAAGASRQETGVPARTTQRWLGWWQGPFLNTEVFVTICARLVGVAVEQLPASIVVQLPGPWYPRVRRMLEVVAPLTTGSVPDGARFVRGIGFAERPVEDGVLRGPGGEVGVEHTRGRDRRPRRRTP
jgi:hypothetical protein